MPIELANAIAAWGSCVAAVVAVIVALYVSYRAELPEVVAYLEHDRDHASMNLVIKNYGKGVARNVRLSGFDYSMADSQMAPSLQRSFIERGVPTLVPGAMRGTAIQAGDSMRGHEDDSCTVTVSYEERRFPFGTKTVSEDFVLDYYSFSGSLYTTSDIHDIKREFEKANKSFEEASTSLAAISSKIELLEDDEGAANDQAV